jgi:hypothetical protein
MAIRRLALVYALWALLICAPAAFADSSGCDAPLVHTVRDVRELVESLHVDGTAQRRVVAPDGIVYTAGEARWMRQQLQLIDQACLRGAEVEAAWRIEALLDNLKLRPAARWRSENRCQAAPVLSEVCSFDVAERGRRTVKMEPTPSRLSTSMLPP